jgi:sugar phosphate isomerase/epimerase
VHYELEGRYESFTLGKEVSVAQVEEISAICARHGFELAGFRSFEKALTDDQIARAWENARRTMQAASRP